MSASLLADTAAVSPGKPFTAGLLLKMGDGWHTYWRDPGDSGFATSVKWILPEGFKVGEMQWPTPLKIVEPGDLKVNVYQDEVLLISEITPPAKIPPDGVTIRAEVKWLACKGSCIPGGGQYALSLPVSGNPAPANTELFQKYRAQISIPEAGLKAPALETAQKRSGMLTFLRHMVLAILGGLILNVMPCVLPVIAVKVYGLIGQAGQSRRRILHLGLAYCAGVFAWFLGLAALITLFGLNWSFQFQSKSFVCGMLAICLFFGLNLLGLFEVLLPSRLNSILDGLSAKEGVSGSFLHGLFATLLGSACTAPLLGPAVGFALTQPPYVVFAISAGIAAGMSFPYLLLSLNPGWLRFVPRPGKWMVRVKQAMGILVLATAAWFGIVLSHQIAVKPGTFPQRLDAALKSGDIVFVDFTAEWCINCKVNEKTVLNSEAVRRAFEENRVRFLTADWSNGDPDITRLLKKYGRAGVPLYVFYPAYGEGRPVVLPEMLTRQIVLDGLSKAKEKP